MPQPSKPQKGRTTKSAKREAGRKKAPPRRRSRPDVAALSRRIAADNARVARFVDGLADRIDAIVEAVTTEKWHEVVRQAEHLADEGAAHGCGEVSIRAGELAQTLRNPYNAATARRQIVRLLGACGRARITDVSDNEGARSSTDDH